MHIASFLFGVVACLVIVGLSLIAYAFLWLRSQAFPADPLPAFVLRMSDGLTFFQGTDLMARITNEQRALLTVQPLTQAGNPAPIDGDVTYSSSDETVARIDVVDGNSAFVTAVGEGAAQIFASFDADLGEGVRTVELSGAIEVVPAEATRGELVFGEPELIPTDPGAVS